jgi:hypothetical protein
MDGNPYIWLDEPYKTSQRGFLRYIIRPVEKGLVCNKKGPICKDPTVEINSIRLVLLVVVW